MSTVKIEIWATTGSIGSAISDVVEFDKEYWESLSEEKKEEEVREVLRLSWWFSWWWNEVNDDSE